MMTHEEQETALDLIGQHRVNYWSEWQVMDALRAEGWKSPSEVAKVRAIHAPVDAVNYGGKAPRECRVCAGCGTDSGNWQTYPCPTIRALDGAR